MYRFCLAAVVCFAACAVFGQSASADEITITVSGELSSAPLHSPVFDSSIRPGTPFTAAFAMDADTGGYTLSYEAVYQNSKKSNGWTINVGDYTIVQDPAYLYTSNKLLIERVPSTDDITIESKYEIASGLTLVDCWVGLADYTATAVTSFTLPPTGPGMTDIGRWKDQHDFYVSASGPGGHGYDYFVGTITNINTAVIVPEPGSVALIVCSGLFSVGLAFRWRRNR